MHTAVQLTFSFEIASLQLTPTFKMGALQLKPTSRIVTMRLAPSQHPQPAMNLQVTFEIATVQLNGNALGMIRLTPSQQQRPSIISSPSFNIAGLAARLRLRRRAGADDACRSRVRLRFTSPRRSRSRPWNSRRRSRSLRSS